MAIAVVLLLLISFLQDHARDKGRHRAAKVVHAVFLILYSVYSLRYFQALGELRLPRMEESSLIPDSYRAYFYIIQLWDLAAVGSGLITALAAFMMRNRWRLARRVFLVAMLVHAGLYVGLIIFLTIRLGDPSLWVDAWTEGRRIVLNLVIPLVFALAASVIYRLRFMKRFFEIGDGSTLEQAGTLDDVVMESRTNQRKT